MLSKTEAAYKILKAAKKPMHVKEIVKVALAKDMINTSGKTPDATLAVELLMENRRREKNGIKPRFKKVGPSTWELIE